MFKFTFGTRSRPKFTPMRPNRVDAHPHLIQYRSPQDDARNLYNQTDLLPVRTRVPEDHIDKNNLWYEVLMDQSHAYYEEIETIPAVVMGEKSFFPVTGHWHIIHPVQLVNLDQWNLCVLGYFAHWIEEKHALYVGTAAQVVEFREKRLESLDVITKELKRRKVGDIPDKIGFLGDWEEVESCDAQIADNTWDKGNKGRLEGDDFESGKIELNGEFESHGPRKSEFEDIDLDSDDDDDYDDLSDDFSDYLVVPWSKGPSWPKLDNQE